MIIGRETITVLQEKPSSPPNEGYIYLYSYNNLLWYMDSDGNEYLLPSSGNALISQLLSGSVYWDTGYTFKVSTCVYMIRGLTYSSDAGTVTLEDADPDLDRIDVIYVDTDLAIGKITGTPSANPQKPMVNPASQLELTYVIVAAGSTSPSVLNEQVYQENVEWATSWNLQAGGLVDFESTTSPFAGTYCIRTSIDPATAGSNLDGVEIYFDSAGTYDITNAILVLMIKTSKPWKSTTGGCYLTLRLYNGTTLISQTPVEIKDGKYGFLSKIASWQAIVVPIADFGANSMVIDQLSIHFNGKWSYRDVTIDFDSIFFQGGVPQPTGHLRLHKMTDPLDHKPADAADRDKYVHSNAITGEWELVSLDIGTGGVVSEIWVEDVTLDEVTYDHIEVLKYLAEEGETQVTTLRKVTEIVTGGELAVVSDLQYTVGAASYYIIGSLYESLGAGVQLNAPHATLPRIDLIVLTGDGAVDKVTGTPAVNPVVPLLNPLNQVLVAEILVFPTLGGSGSQLVELSGDVIGTGYTGTTIETTVENMTLDSSLTGGDHSSSGIKATFIANENQAFGDVVRINSDGKAQIACADEIAHATVVGMLVDSSVTTGNTGTYLLLGFARNDSWAWTQTGTTVPWLFLSLDGTTGNTLTQENPADIPCDEGNVIQMVGVIKGEDLVYFNPQLVQIEHK